MRQSKTLDMTFSDGHSEGFIRRQEWDWRGCQARQEGLTLSKNHHTQARRKAVEGVAAPVSPHSRGGKDAGEMGTCWPHLQHHACPHSVPMQAEIGGVLEPFSSPLRSGSGPENWKAQRSSLGGLAQVLHKGNQEGQG